MTGLTRKVLIESDWNLKIRVDRITQSRLEVLIESDWNLKAFRHCKGIRLRSGINRIRLEFKDIQVSVSFNVAFCINRIRLEFKGKRVEEIPEEGRSINRIRLEFKANNHTIQGRFIFVLIESDWNLKNISSRPSWNFVKWY